MTSKIYSIDEIKAMVAPIAEQYGVARIFLFGSYARGEAKPDSDLDFRVDKGSLRGLILRKPLIKSWTCLPPTAWSRNFWIAYQARRF